MADTIPEAKIVLLGASNVGKTSLVTRFTSGEFDPSIKNTVGACYASKVVQVDNETVKLQIWDTAGQEKFRTLVPMYFRGAKVAILVFSVVDVESQKDVAFWANSVKQGTAQTPTLFVVGNKIDLAGSRTVSPESGKETALEVNAEYIETSAKDDTNLDELLKKIARAALQQVKSDAPQPKTQTITTTQKKKKDGCC